MLCQTYSGFTEHFVLGEYVSVSVEESKSPCSLALIIKIEISLFCNDFFLFSKHVVNR